MRRNIILTIVICIVIISTISFSEAVPVTDGNYTGKSIIANDSSICLQINNNYLRIDFINPSVFRIRMNNKDNFPEGGMVRYGIVNTRCQPQQIKKTSSGSTP